MRKSIRFFCDYVVPVFLIVGHVILAWYLTELLSYGDGGLSAFVAVSLYWLYGIAFVTDVIPFFKRLFKHRT